MNDNPPPNQSELVARALHAVSRLSMPDPREASEQQADEQASDRAVPLIGLIMFMLYGFLFGLLAGWMVWG